MHAADQMGMTAGTHTLPTPTPRLHLSSRSTFGLERSITTRLAILGHHQSQQERLPLAPSKDSRGARTKLAMRQGQTMPSMGSLMAQGDKIAGHTARTLPDSSRMQDSKPGRMQLLPGTFRRYGMLT